MKIRICVSLIVAFVLVALYVFRQADERFANKKADQPPAKQVPPAKEKPRLAKEREAKPQGPLSFWTGEIIIGEGPNRGKIELVADEGYQSIVLVADESGKCAFDAVPGMKAGEMYIRLLDRGEAPMISCVAFKNGQETAMHSVYQTTRRYKEGKLGPRLFPQIESPVERLQRQKGSALEGFTWSIRSRSSQLYGYEEPEKTRQASSRINLGPVVKAKLGRFQINLKESYYTAEQLAEMAKADAKFSGEHDRENQTWDYKTSLGLFRVITCCDRYSVNPKAKNRGGWCFSTLNLPNGKSRRDVGLQEVFEIDGDLYLICSHYIFKFLGETEKLECVATFEGVDGVYAPYINRRLVAGRFFSVNKSSDSNLGGLLEYRAGEWLFHPYQGDWFHWVETSEEKEGFITLNLFGGQKVRFDPVEGTFRDL